MSKNAPEWVRNLQDKLVLHVIDLGEGRFTEVVDVVAAYEQDEDSGIWQIATQGGHTFWATDPAVWLVLGPAEAEFFQNGQRIMNSMVAGMVTLARGLQVPPAQGLRLLRSLFQAQMRQLNEDHVRAALAPQEASPDGITEG